VLVFIDLNISPVVHKQEPLLIVLELISNGSGLKPLLMKLLSENHLSAMIQDLEPLLICGPTMVQDKLLLIGCIIKLFFLVVTSKQN
jgi:hypothetical protein